MIPGDPGNGELHLTLWIMARGINNGLRTRLCFAVDPCASILLQLGKDDRATLIGMRDADAPAPVYRFDVRLRGDRETVLLQSSALRSARHEGLRSGRAWTVMWLTLQQISLTAGVCLNLCRELTDDVLQIGCETSSCACGY